MNDLTTRAEAELLALLRSAPEMSFTLTITRESGRWTVVTGDHDATGSSSTRGRGESFADAWRRQHPAWTRPTEVEVAHG